MDHAKQEAKKREDQADWTQRYDEPRHDDCSIGLLPKAMVAHAEDCYAGLTNDIFDGILESLVAGMTASSILAIPGVYEAVKEELNNDILGLWEQDHPEQEAQDA